MSMVTVTSTSTLAFHLTKASLCRDTGYRGRRSSSPCRCGPSSWPISRRTGASTPSLLNYRPSSMMCFTTTCTSELVTLLFQLSCPKPSGGRMLKILGSESFTRWLWRKSVRVGGRETLRHTSRTYGSYTLYGTETETGTGYGIGTVENNGSLSLFLSLCSVYITQHSIETHCSWSRTLSLSRLQSCAVCMSHYKW